MESIAYKERSEILGELADYPEIRRNWEFSYEHMIRIKEEIEKKLDDESISIAIAGSFGRFDAIV